MTDEEKRNLIRRALEAFRTDSSYVAEMINAARVLEKKRRR